METSLKKSIYDLAKSRCPEWVNGGEFERLALSVLKKPSNASRRARELCREGYLERRINEKRCVEYRAIPREERVKELSQEEILRIATG